MRKIILLNAVIFFSFFQLSAQLQKNQIYVGVTGEKRFSQVSTIGVRPSFSVGLNSFSAVGSYFDYTRYKAWNYLGHEGYTESLGIGVFYSYYRYFGKSEKWGWFANADISLNRIRGYETTPTTTLANQYNQTRLSLTPGIFYKPSANILLHLDIGGLTFFHDGYQNKLKSNFGSQINIGINVGFGRGSKKKIIAKSIY